MFVLALPSRQPWTISSWGRAGFGGAGIGRSSALVAASANSTHRARAHFTVAVAAQLHPLVVPASATAWGAMGPVGPQPVPTR